MPPPELAGNTPVTDILQPVHIDFIKTVRYELQTSVFQCLDGSLSHLFHSDKPLGLDHWLHCSAAAVMGSHTVGMRHYLYQQPLLLQVSDHGFSGLIAVHACIFAAQLIDGGIVVHDIDFRQVMAFSHFKVIGVVCRCDLHASGTKLLVYIFICHNRNFPVSERQLQHFSNQVFVSLILRIDSNSRITQERLRTCGGNFHITALFACDGVIDMPEKSVLVLMLYLCVGDGCLAYRTPVDNTGSFVDVTFFV